MRTVTEALCTPGLDLWLEELAAGLEGQDPARPGSWGRDGLWRAAMWEQSALEAHALGNQQAARAAGERARRALQESSVAGLTPGDRTWSLAQYDAALAERRSRSLSSRTVATPARSHSA